MRRIEECGVWQLKMFNEDIRKADKIYKMWNSLFCMSYNGSWIMQEVLSTRCVREGNGLRVGPEHAVLQFPSSAFKSVSSSSSLS